ncbi:MULTISPECIES: SycD/LcrH family type III secretion system chaperone [Providencia]|nr:MULTISPECIES: SycD/LcrH family type III secretion system chaperone [Providencia]EIL1984923.1 SycD/LcrH family type III secretion system chaperone [Providencia rettgeri]EIU7557805.1 SycD/LcrH family type III secretion system chaperone [Providencia rettgeri]EIU9514130.1 SycD/LcrH family type III secretion system chaperone [Providencia rettgeri]EJD6044341.1 SycD/LcrH family type III secretion system chaperone [Providencia rettgeri]EJD6367536.1 SycD/LcrH family type III secretion system chapero
MPKTVSTLSQNENSDNLQHFLARGGSLKLIAGLDSQQLERLYAYANQLFNANDFSAARNIYYLLTCLEQWNPENLLALGLCHQRLGEHENAINNFVRAGTIKIDDPRPAFFTGLSYHLLGNTEYANKAFHAAIRWCNDLKEYQEIKQSAQKMLNPISEISQ